MAPGAATLRSVGISPEALRSGGEPRRGVVDYRLARDAVVRQFRNGRLARHEVCDAHPELLRVARGHGRPSRQDCPICEDTRVVFVSYVFGKNLPAQGTCLNGRTDARKALRRGRDMRCYVVEVCPDCQWNHLAKAFPVRATGSGR